MSQTVMPTPTPTPTRTRTPRTGQEDSGITLMEHGSVGDADDLAWMFLAVDETIKFYWSQVGDSYWTGIIDLTPANFKINEWYHLAISLSDKKLKGFVDGALSGQGIVSSPIKNSKQPIIIGRRLGASGAYFFKGYMQDIKISKNNVY